jgi:hypothetical protein
VSHSKSFFVLLFYGRAGRLTAKNDGFRPGQTHAAGTFSLMLGASVAVAMAADLVSGKTAMLHGKAGGFPPVWSYQGDGPAFVVGPQVDLEIRRVVVAAVSGLAFRVAGSALLRLAGLQLQKGDGSAAGVSCAGLATGVGEGGLTCVDTGAGGVAVRSPLFISTSGVGFGMGATKYMGQDRGVFEEAVSTKEPGLYTCQISHDEIVALSLPVESAMHVSIVGDDSMPQWSFTGEGPTFTVAVHAYLNLAYVTLPGGQVSLMRGGEVSLDHVQMQRTQLHVAGSLAVSNSQLADVQFETESAAVMTMDAVTISGTGTEPLVLPMGCSVTINGGEIRNAELQVTSDGELILTGTAIYVEGMAVSVATVGSVTVSTSQLIHSEMTDPFPCSGANMACSGPHAGSVMVAGPASINTAAPLVCADESAGSCLPGYVDMPSCLADIARGMESCFVYLQRDTGEIGTISVDAREHFEIHGNQGEPKLRLFADFGVSRVLILADLTVVGGSGHGFQMSVETGGRLTFERVQMEGGSLTFAGVVSLLESSLVEVMVTGSSRSELSLSGGTVTGSAVTMTSGVMVVDTGCVLTDSPIDVGGAGGTVTISGVELRSDGFSVPLTVEAGGAATVTESVFRSTAGDITAVSVTEGGSLTVGESQLVEANGSANPLPCIGTLLDCAGVHDGSVVVEGPSAVTLASPLVCDVETGDCLADVCLARGDVCAEAGPGGWAPGNCIDAVCVCSVTGGGLAPAVSWGAASGGIDLAVCLADDVGVAVGTPCSCSHGGSCSPTITVANSAELHLDCGKVGKDTSPVAPTLCRMLDRLEVVGPATLILRGLLFDGLSFECGGGGQGGAVLLQSGSGASASLASCMFRSNSASDWGGAIMAKDSTMLTVTVCTFESNHADGVGGAIALDGATAFITATTFTANTCRARDASTAMYCDSSAVLNSGHTPVHGLRYTNDAANAALGGGAGRRLLALKKESTTNNQIKSGDSGVSSRLSTRTVSRLDVLGSMTGR